MRYGQHVQRQLHPAVRSRPGSDSIEVGADRGLFHDHLGGDLLVAGASQDQFDELGLSWRQLHRSNHRLPVRCLQG